MLRNTSTTTTFTMTTLLLLASCTETSPRVNSPSAEEETEPLEVETTALGANTGVTDSCKTSTCTGELICSPKRKSALCAEVCPCESGLGDCDTDLDCVAGLVCGYNNGPQFGLPPGWETCVPPHCENDALDAELGEGPGADCGGVCGTCLNFALGRVATQSSTCFDLGPERANDGITDGNMSNGSVSHTCTAGNEWWQVDLGGGRNITEIRVWNRTDCCGDRLSNWWVFVTTRDPGNITDPHALAAASITRFSAFFPTGPDPTQIIQIPATRGRYVRVFKEATSNGDNWLHIAEVEVFGY